MTVPGTFDDRKSCTFQTSRHSQRQTCVQHLIQAEFLLIREANQLVYDQSVFEPKQQPGCSISSLLHCSIIHEVTLSECIRPVPDISMDTVPRRHGNKI